MNPEIPENPNKKVNRYLRELEDNAINHPAAIVVQSMAQCAIEQNRKIMGQIAIEMLTSDKPVSLDDLNILFCAFPSGEYYCWFVELGYYVVIVLVNETTKCLLALDVMQQDEFPAKLNNIANQLNLKNNYPVLNPEMFKPAGERPDNLRKDDRS